MILFFRTTSGSVIAVEVQKEVSNDDLQKLEWLFGNASKAEGQVVDGWFVGPRKEMVTPWSTNAVEITQNMGVSGISRIEEYLQFTRPKHFHYQSQA